MASNRIVSSTIVRPETHVRVPGRKRSFPDAPEPARRRSSSNISTRLGPLSNDLSSSSTLTTTAESTNENESSNIEGLSGTVGLNEGTIDSKISESPTSSTFSPTTATATATISPGETGERGEAGEAGEAGNSGETNRAKRPRLGLNPAEDTNRGRRMMGMILGTLTQFKKQTDQSSQNNGPNASGIASREALQERVREKLRKEQELNEELRKKEQQEREKLREQRLKQRQGASLRGRRGEARWENGYILSETRPRLRYMPKVMNDVTRRKFEAQIKKDKRGSFSASAQATSLDTTNSKVKEQNDVTAPGMDLDLDDVVADMVVDVKDKPDSPDEPVTAKAEDDNVASETSTSIKEVEMASEEGIQEPADRTKEEEEKEKEPKEDEEDVVMADKSSNSAGVDKPNENSSAVNNENPSDEPELINIKIV
ncbi:hypothetical protein BX616_004784 [Lobosporangium transversale]|nr:hypothetical protein BX616_004784 [Lobosporangium transversale]